jgi:hypothetical protein
MFNEGARRRAGRSQPALTMSAFSGVYVIFSFPIIFCGEGPRSRGYEPTAALELIVQPCGEDDSFFRFSVSWSTDSVKLTGESRSTPG